MRAKSNVDTNIDIDDQHGNSREELKLQAVHVTTYVKNQSSKQPVHSSNPKSEVKVQYCHQVGKPQPGSSKSRIGVASRESSRSFDRESPGVISQSATR